MADLAIVRASQPCQVQQDCSAKQLYVAWRQRHSEASLHSLPQRLPSSAEQQKEWTDLKLLQLAPRLLNLEPSKQLL